MNLTSVRTTEPPGVRSMNGRSANGISNGISAARAPSAAPGVSPLDALRILSSAGGALFDQALLHGQLAQVELEQEKNRLLKMVWISLLGFACLLCVMLFTGALVLAATWETAYRLPAVSGLVLVYGVATAIAWNRLKAVSALGGRTFAASREELAADAALLKRNL